MFLKVLQEYAGARVFFNKVAGLKSYNFIKSRLQHRCFPVNFCKFLRKTHPANNSKVWQNPNDPDDEKKHFKQPQIAIERLYFGKPSEELQKEWKNRIDKLDRRYRDLLLQEHCNKLSNLMGNFWCDISYAEVDAFWLLKVKTNLTSLIKFSQKSNGGSSEKYLRIPYLTKWFLKDLMNTFRFSNLNLILMHFDILNFQTLSKNL